MLTSKMKENWIKPSKSRINNPKRSPVFWSSPTKGVSKKNLTYPLAKLRYPKLRARGDADRDVLWDGIDCINNKFFHR